MASVEMREAVTIENQGEKLFGIIHRPLKYSENGYKGPAILICPGFAGSKCGKMRMFVNLGKKLAELGITVFRFDYRGAGDSEGEFSDITIEGEVSDTLKCLDFLMHDAQIDPARIGILGRSLGGVIAVLAACRSKHIKSLALLAPVFKSDPWKELWKSMQSNAALEKAEKELLHHLPANVPNISFLKEFFQLDLPSALEQLKDIPLLHIHGEKDQVVKIEQAKDFEETRKGIANSRFVKLSNSDHDFSDLAEQKEAIDEIALWYQKTLNPSASA